MATFVGEPSAHQWRLAAQLESATWNAGEPDVAPGERGHVSFVVGLSIVSGRRSHAGLTRGFVARVRSTGRLQQGYLALRRSQVRLPGTFFGQLRTRRGTSADPLVGRTPAFNCEARLDDCGPPPLPSGGPTWNALRQLQRLVRRQKAVHAVSPAVPHAKVYWPREQRLARSGLRDSPPVAVAGGVGRCSRREHAWTGNDARS